ncbi:MAG TPA: hypothetical protein VG937_02335 [Polyangiaceae bacterium]|jgi:hypothetical protein|nr:hypothetical protein [Polyangiaceae bacterium]
MQRLDLAQLLEQKNTVNQVRDRPAHSTVFEEGATVDSWFIKSALDPH